MSFEDQGRSPILLGNRGLLNVHAESSTGRFLGAEMLTPAGAHLARSWALQNEMSVARMLSMPMRNLLLSLCLGVSIGICAQTANPAEVAEGFGKPALVATADLAGFDALAEDRRKLIEGAIAVARDSPWLRYTPRSADPSQGGFDCSGAMYFVLRKAGLEPPRSAAEQLRWLKSNERLHEVPRDATELKHPSLKKLRPGDLLFWGTPGSADDGGKVNITHVAMYLGAEKRDGRPVMINSTDGRSYRGTRANGYGVYDFRLPPPGAEVAFMGYGTPPGITEMSDP